MYVARDKFGKGYYLIAIKKMRIVGDEYLSNSWFVEIPPDIFHKLTKLRLKKGEQVKKSKIVFED